MTRTQIQQIIVITLLLVFGFIWINTRKGPASAPIVTTAPAPEAGPRAAPSRPLIPGLKEGPASEADLARDLFQIPKRLLQKIRDRRKAAEKPPPKQGPVVEAPVVAPSIDLSTLNLQGIFWGTDRPQAIINRRILSVGDTIEGAEISTISKEGVTLTFNGQTMELKPKGVRHPDNGAE